MAGGFFHKPMNLMNAVVHGSRVYHSVVMDPFPWHRLDGHHAAPGVFVHLQHLCDDAGAMRDDVIGQYYHERFAAHRFFRRQDGMPQTQGLFLDDKRHLG